MNNEMKKLNEEELNEAAGGFSTNLNSVLGDYLRDDVEAVEAMMSNEVHERYKYDFDGLKFSLYNAWRDISIYNDCVMLFGRLFDALRDIPEENQAFMALVAVYDKFKEWS